jgi:glucose-6-phosphate isomerase/transaldolase/glucose-6-phosphate isomerase
MIKTINLEPLEKEIDSGLARLAEQKIIPRIWDKDWTVWRDEPTEVADRLGWLTSPHAMEKETPGIREFADSVRRSDFTRALLLGMGGSSLAPLVLAEVFKTRKGYLDLEILDSTDPAAVLRAQKKDVPEKTLFIVSSKSGTTIETISFFKYFWNWTAERLGEAGASTHFAAITDPRTPLEDLAHRLKFRAIFRGNPEIGGRFSALSPFCLVPAALKGIDIGKLLRAAQDMARLCREAQNLRANPGALLGTVIGVAALSGRDKLTFTIPHRLGTFGLWLEQLIAESTGKNGKGILPVEGEDIRCSVLYGADRLFVGFQTKNDKPSQTGLARLAKGGLPTLKLKLPGLSGLGAQFFLWEFATAVAGFFLRINPFDQPDVESTKKKTQELLRTFRESGALPRDEPRLREKEISWFSDLEASSGAECLKKFLEQARAGDYLAIQAFLAQDRRTQTLLSELRRRLGATTGLPTTVGFGPRFLHSTGQLHKGDRGNGLFIQITAGGNTDAPIPDEPGSAVSTVSFGVLKAAQAGGDFAALRAAGRRIVGLDLGREAEAGLRTILSYLGSLKLSK